MKTILEPAKPFMKLLGKQNYRAEETYRLMYFVVQAEVDDGLLLLHNMTKEMVLLSKEEQRVFEHCPTDLPELIDRWFLVPIGHDDCKLSRQILEVARMIAQPRPHITDYTIMTTSDCNARCFYCYELGQSRRPMTEETALQTADYIIGHCGGEAVSIVWFGGEPLFNKPVISLICHRLKEAGVKYSSTMVTNGYLMDADTVKEAHDLWNLEHVQITLDGTEQTYNRVKAYIYKGVNAYERVMENIGHLIAAGIEVVIRMNLDMHNADNLERLAEELHERFKDDTHLYAYLRHLFEDKAGRTGMCHDDTRRELLQRMRQINDKMAAWKQWKGNNYVARIKSNFCNADNDAHVVIQPDGYITKCEHYTDSHHIGHISREGFDEAPRARFKKRGTKLMEACEHCVRYPDCFFLLSCPNYRECYAEMPEMYEHMLQQDMKAMYQDYLEKGVTNR